jgi:hypothetical protein
MNNFEIYITFKSRTIRNNYPVGKVPREWKALLQGHRNGSRPIEAL